MGESKAQGRDSSETHADAIRREFAKQAPSFEDPKYSPLSEVSLRSGVNAASFG